MTWQEHDDAQKLLDKLKSGAALTKEEIMKALMLLLKDYWDRGLE